MVGENMIFEDFLAPHVVVGSEADSISLLGIDQSSLRTANADWRQQGKRLTPPRNLIYPPPYNESGR
jgi:hypothetical protein